MELDCCGARVSSWPGTAVVPCAWVAETSSRYGGHLWDGVSLLVGTAVIDKFMEELAMTSAGLSGSESSVSPSGLYSLLLGSGIEVSLVAYPRLLHCRKLVTLGTGSMKQYLLGCPESWGCCWTLLMSHILRKVSHLPTPPVNLQVVSVLLQVHKVTEVSLVPY